MKKLTLLNIIFNLLVAALFVFLNMQAINLGYKGSFVAYALIYGIVVTVGNAIFMIIKKWKN